MSIVRGVNENMPARSDWIVANPEVMQPWVSWISEEFLENAGVLGNFIRLPEGYRELSYNQTSRKCAGSLPGNRHSGTIGQS